jgi:hypothetical protein
MTPSGRNRLAAGAPATDRWTEKLQCNFCASIGTVILSQGDRDPIPTVLSISDCFKVVQTDYGPDFHCATCKVAVRA